MRKRTAGGKSTTRWRLSFWRFSIGFRIITALFHIAEWLEIKGFRGLRLLRRLFLYAQLPQAQRQQCGQA